MRMALACACRPSVSARRMMSSLTSESAGCVYEMMLVRYMNVSTLSTE